MSVIVETLQDAVEQNASLHLSYRGKERDVLPVKLGRATNGNLFLTAWDNTDEGYRNFTLEKVAQIEVGKEYNNIITPEAVQYITSLDPNEPLVEQR